MMDNTRLSKFIPRAQRLIAAGKRYHPDNGRIDRFVAFASGLGLLIHEDDNEGLLTISDERGPMLELIYDGSGWIISVAGNIRPRSPKLFEAVVELLR